MAADSQTQEVSIPAQLLAATGNLGTLRDTRSSLTWEPQPAIPESIDGCARSLSQHGMRYSISKSSKIGWSLRRTSRKGSGLGMGHEERPHRRESLSPCTTPQEQQCIRRKLSFEPGTNDVLDVSSPTSKRSSTIFAGNVFDELTIDSSGTSRAVPHDDQISPHDAPDVEGDASHSHEVQRQRRATFEDVVDHIVPDAIQRTFTNSSVLRKSSIWQTYETAKTRSKNFQRMKWVQLTFEYSIYVFILAFIYFVLVGVPIWNGAVYWLWWVVANKFVIAGGFSITLGVALL
jgi:hypothetical protein